MTLAEARYDNSVIVSRWLDPELSLILVPEVPWEPDPVSRTVSVG